MNRVFLCHLKILVVTLLLPLISFTQISKDKIVVTTSTTGLFSTSTEDLDKKLHCISLNVYPNPFEGSPNIDIKSNCKSDVPIKVVDAVGQVIYKHTRNTLSNPFNPHTIFDGLPAGIYFLSIGSGQNGMKHNLLKMK